MNHKKIDRILRHIMALSFIGLIVCVTALALIASQAWAGVGQ